MLCLILATHERRPRPQRYPHRRFDFLTYDSHNVDGDHDSFDRAVAVQHKVCTKSREGETLLSTGLPKCQSKMKWWSAMPKFKIPDDERCLAYISVSIIGPI